MKPLLFKIHSRRAPSDEPITADDNLGRGMDLALTIAAFLILGLLLDAWLGTSPLFTVALLVLAAVGSFVRMKYAYDAVMEQHEAQRLARRAAAPRPTPSSESPASPASPAPMEDVA